MAGFFIVLGDETTKVTDDKTNKEKIIVTKSAEKILAELCENGYYSTNLSPNNSERWSKSKISTFADYFSMRSGDYIFFFSQRKIYGVGELTNLDGLNDCKFWAYKDASNPKTELVTEPLFDDIKIENRCICFFKPIKYFSHPIDMDEALTTYPNAFKAIRVIQNLTFIKIDDEEANALYAILSKANSTSTNSYYNWTPPEFRNTNHQNAIKTILNNPDAYEFSIESLIKNSQIFDKSGSVMEIIIEAALIDYLNKGNVIGSKKFDYISHQVAASPAKPISYMDWIDVFGYMLSQDLVEKSIPIPFAIEKYFVVEIKKECLCMSSRGNKEIKETAHQLMKYIDWIANNYANGKYPMVYGIIVAKDFNKNFIEYCKKECTRNYNKGYRNPEPTAWHNFSLVKYTFNGESITFEEIFNAEEKS